MNWPATFYSPMIEDPTMNWEISIGEGTPISLCISEKEMRMGLVRLLTWPATFYSPMIEDPTMSWESSIEEGEI
jgi:hypothetical protein